MSLSAFSVKEGAETENVTQGLLSRTPASGAESVNAGIEGFGCVMAEIMPVHKFPPAESPPITTCHASA